MLILTLRPLRHFTNNKDDNYFSIGNDIFVHIYAEICPATYHKNIKIEIGAPKELIISKFDDAKKKYEEHREINKRELE